MVQSILVGFCRALVAFYFDSFVVSVFDNMVRFSSTLTALVISSHLSPLAPHSSRCTFYLVSSIHHQQARRYDSRTTIFSPEGRLYQVEYAMEAISHASACVGILATDGVVLAAEKRVASKLLDPGMRSDNMYQVDDHIACAVAGITADANILMDYVRRVAQNHTYTFQEPQPVELLVRRICDMKQGYTQYGGMTTARWMCAEQEGMGA